jgi:hypothetical protein
MSAPSAAVPPGLDLAIKKADIAMTGLFTAVVKLL